MIKSENTNTLDYDCSFNNIVIHQPNLFPNIKCLQKIVSGDIWVILDDVQFVRRELQNRCKIRKLENVEEENWLTANIKKASRDEQIRNIKFHHFNEFKDKTLKQLYFTYSNSRNWDFIKRYLEKVFNEDYVYLSDFCVKSTLIFLNELDIHLTVAYSSNYNINVKSTERLVELCKVFKGENYISGLGGLNYMNLDLFKLNNIEVIIHEWEQPSLDDNLSWKNISFLDFVARYDISKIKHYLKKSKSLKV
ncbi:WbqC family protein [Virgibacillus halodenitrificans]|uniref:WbqC family protein n=1 Tax=Virgibacillus halodenitrificans TaxID=1482 RepID=UPI0013CE6764|nr:WbqC family protein [Virgibacillus halodenitrificans]